MSDKTLTVPLVVLAVLALAGCAVGPEYRQPDTPVPTQFGSLEATRFSSAAGVNEFWTVFSDTTLDELVKDALAANHDLRIALAHLDEARALRGAARLDLPAS